MRMQIIGIQVIQTRHIPNAVGNASRNLVAVKVSYLCLDKDYSLQKYVTVPLVYAGVQWFLVSAPSIHYWQKVFKVFETATLNL